MRCSSSAVGSHVGEWGQLVVAACANGVCTSERLAIGPLGGALLAALPELLDRVELLEALPELPDWSERTQESTINSRDNAPTMSPSRSFIAVESPMSAKAPYVPLSERNEWLADTFH